MFDYLSAPMGVGRHRIRLPRYPYVQNGLKANLLKYQQYYQENVYRVSSDHLLVRMIQGSPLQWAAEDRLFLNAARDLMYEVSNSLELTSNVSRGKTHYPGVFYGLGVAESIMVHDEAFDVFTPWDELRPVRVHRHPGSGTDLYPLDGDSPEVSGWAAISINYPMLLWVYRQWRLTDKAYIDDYALSTAHFVRMIILPWMVEDHLDLSIFNRLYNGLFKVEDETRDRKTPFYQIDYQDKLDESLEEYLSQIDRRNLSLEELLSSIPTAHHETYYSLLGVPDVITNSQTRWWFWIAYLPTLKFWCAYDYLSDNNRNLTEQKALLKELIRTKRSRWLPKEVEDEISFDLVMLEEWLTA